MVLVCPRCEYRSKRVKLTDCPKCGIGLEQADTAESGQWSTKTRKFSVSRRREKRTSRQDESDGF